MTMSMTTPTIDPDTLSMGAIRDGALRDRPVAVLGFARSGIALARFLLDAGARVTVYDGRPASELADAVHHLEGFEIEARKRVTPRRPARIPTIQKRSVIFSSSQPASSKW